MKFDITITSPHMACPSNVLISCQPSLHCLDQMGNKLDKKTLINRKVGNKTLSPKYYQTCKHRVYPPTLSDVQLLRKTYNHNLAR
jgi:hypothetical protein